MDITQNRKSEAELKALIAMATRLGFWNDVVHFTKELKKVQNGK